MQNNNIPITTLFMLMSLDGKISSGDNDSLDVDKDWCTIEGVKEGLNQYYEIEQTTDLYSLNTGRVMEKIGVNTRKDIPGKSPVNFIIIDRKPHIDDNGINYICNWVNKLFIVTNNLNHPAFNLKEKYSNLNIIFFDNEIDLLVLLEKLKSDYNVERITIQSGGTLNSEFLRKNLFNYVNIVIAPILVGGKDTATLIDGYSIKNRDELNKLKALKVVECNVLKDSYIQLKYSQNHLRLINYSPQ